MLSVVSPVVADDIKVDIVVVGDNPEVDIEVIGDGAGVDVWAPGASSIRLNGEFPTYYSVVEILVPSKEGIEALRLVNEELGPWLAELEAKFGISAEAIAKLIGALEAQRSDIDVLGSRVYVDIPEELKQQNLALDWLNDTAQEQGIDIEDLVRDLRSLSSREDSRYESLLAKVELLENEKVVGSQWLIGLSSLVVLLAIGLIIVGIKKRS